MTVARRRRPGATAAARPRARPGRGPRGDAAAHRAGQRAPVDLYDRPVGRARLPARPRPARTGSSRRCSWCSSTAARIPLFALLFGYGIAPARDPARGRRRAAGRRGAARPAPRLVDARDRAAPRRAAVAGRHRRGVRPARRAASPGVLVRGAGGHAWPTWPSRARCSATCLRGLLGLAAAVRAPRRCRRWPSRPADRVAFRAVEWAGRRAVSRRSLGAFGAVALGAWAARQPAARRPRAPPAAAASASPSPGSAPPWSAGCRSRSPSPGCGRRRCRPCCCSRRAARRWAATRAASATRRCSGCSLYGSRAGDPGSVVRALCERAGSARCRATSRSRWRSSRCSRPGRSAWAAAPPLWRLSLVGLGVWLVILLVAVVSARAGYRGPAETLLRRLTYGARRPRPGPAPSPPAPPSPPAGRRA